MFTKLKKDIQFQIRKLQWKKRNSHNDTYMGRLFNIDSVLVGKDTYGGINAITYERENVKLKIGNYCSISENVVFMLGGQHNYKFFSSYPFDKKVFNCSMNSNLNETVIGDDVWIGYGALIFPGINVGQGAVIGAKAVVTRDIPPYAIVAGAPAKIIKFRFSEEIIQYLLRIDYSRLDKKVLDDNMKSLFVELDTLSIYEIKDLLSLLPKKNI